LSSRHWHEICRCYKAMPKVFGFLKFASKRRSGGENASIETASKGTLPRQEDTQEINKWLIGQLTSDERHVPSMDSEGCTGLSDVDQFLHEDARQESSKTLVKERLDADDFKLCTALSNVNCFIEHNVRTVSKASLARSGSITARSANSVQSIPVPISKVMRDISSLLLEADGGPRVDPEVLETALGDVENFINANARTISGALTARSGGLTARSTNSCCSGRPITKVLREIDAF